MPTSDAPDPQLERVARAIHTSQRADYVRIAWPFLLADEREFYYAAARAAVAAMGDTTPEPDSTAPGFRWDVQPGMPFVDTPARSEPVPVAPQTQHNNDIPADLVHEVAYELHNAEHLEPEHECNQICSNFKDETPWYGLARTAIAAVRIAAARAGGTRP